MISLESSVIKTESGIETKIKTNTLSKKEFDYVQSLFPSHNTFESFKLGMILYIYVKTNGCIWKKVGFCIFDFKTGYIASIYKISNINIAKSLTGKILLSYVVDLLSHKKYITANVRYSNVIAKDMFILQGFKENKHIGYYEDGEIKIQFVKLNHKNFTFKDYIKHYLLNALVK